MKDNNSETRFDHQDSHRIDENFNPLPRSVIRRSPYELLDGKWRFELDPEDRGLEEQWYLSHDFSKTTHFPGALESHMESAREIAEADSSPQHQHDAIVAWYEREFSIPESWQSSDNSLTQLTFGACGYETRVWLNGHLLRTIEGEEIHFGEYSSFSYEFPAEYLKPVNRLTIRVADSMDAEIPRGKQASHVYKQGGIWYQTISGAVRSLWIEPVGRNRLRTRLNVTSNVNTHLVEFDLKLRIHDPGDYLIRLKVTPFGEKNALPLTAAEYHLTLGAGEKYQRFPIQMPQAHLWSPSTPNLYNLLAELVAPDGTATGIETHFGLREFRTRGREIYLNGSPIYLDGILYQPHTSTYEEMRRHFYAMKKLGCNLVRVHIAGIDPRIYDLADQIGLLLWIEVPSPHSSSQRSRDNHWAELNQILLFAASHPSVVILSLYNEDWGAEDIQTSESTRKYIASTYNFLHINVPQLLIVDNDGWNHVSVSGKLKSDLLTAHIYTTELPQWQKLLDNFVNGNTDNVAVQPLVIGDPYFYAGQVPIIVSEWGGFGFSWYGGPGEGQEDKRNKIIADFKREMRQRPIAGDVYTQATSIEEETNGIIDEKTGELLVAPGILSSDTLS